MQRYAAPDLIFYNNIYIYIFIYCIIVTSNSVSYSHFIVAVFFFRVFILTLYDLYVIVNSRFYTENVFNVKLRLSLVFVYTSRYVYEKTYLVC